MLVSLNYQHGILALDIKGNKKQGAADGEPLTMPLSDYLKIVIDTVKAPFTANVSFLSYFTVNFPQIIALRYLGYPPYRSNSKLRH